ncbi:MAG: hypothetical protein ABSF53_16220 [Terracidiphilus sp.]|jgi:hypothetical protein
MKTIVSMALTVVFVSTAFASADVVSAVHGSIVKIDSGARIVVVKTADGTRHSLHLIDRTAVHGAETSADAVKDSWHGLAKGSEVVAHYTSRASLDTVVEIDRVGRDGLKTARGTVTDVGRGGKTLVVDTGDGVKKTFELTDHASEDAGKDIAKRTIKGSKVAVYYTEDAGKSVAHFFEVL